MMMIQSTTRSNDSVFHIGPIPRSRLKPIMEHIKKHLMMMQQLKSTSELDITSNFFLSQLYTQRLWAQSAAFGVLLTSLVFGGIKDDAESIINGYFGEGSSLIFRKIELEKAIKFSIEKEVKQRFYSSFVYAWTVTQNDSIEGYALLDNVKGKSMPITFIVLYNTNGSVVHSAVVKYREPIGGEVGRQSWLDQFLGKNSSSVYDEIDAISGATISVNSVTRGINKLTLLLNVIKDELIIHD
jgi:Na+-translocating ferredoxin:NAD+ oxidoreductase RnfG subunit